MTGKTINKKRRKPAGTVQTVRITQLCVNGQPELRLQLPGLDRRGLVFYPLELHQRFGVGNGSSEPAKNIFTLVC